VTLSSVRVNGGTSDASADERVFAFLTFKTSDIEDINVLENAEAAAAAASATPEPLVPQSAAPQPPPPPPSTRQELDPHRPVQHFCQRVAQLVIDRDAVASLEVAALRDLTRPLSPFRQPDDAIMRRSRDLARR
jgi:hypothetical protein